jgi:endonuclease/exonuclease/phosphatase family metal-dependent hydrolase
MPRVEDRGLAILSRYPLSEVQIRALKPFDLRFHSRKRFALLATAVTPWGPVRLVDVHLDTRLNLANRLEQLEPVMRDTAARRIIAGDFNSNPFYWVEHVLPLPALHSQAAGIHQFMTRSGFRTSIGDSATTHDLGMHLDWIWVAGMRPTTSEITPLRYSDHHAVESRLEF